MTQIAPKTIDVDAAAADIENKAKSAYAKGSAVAGEIGAMAKGNVEALVTSGKILGAGFKQMGENSVTEGKQAVDVFLADLKAFAAVKSPKEFFDLQFKLTKRSLDRAIALTGKNGEALGKLASLAAVPISAQVNANVGKLRKIA
jgi:hypothetical protein